MTNQHLIFTDLSGHRTHWLDLILESPRDLETIILHFPESNRQLITNSLSTKQRLIQTRFHPDAGFTRSVISEVLADDVLIDWDGDHRQFDYFFVRKKTRILIMRPYLQKKSFLSLGRYVLKMLASYVLSSKKNIDIFFLAIPGHEPKIFKNMWVNDFVDATNQSLMAGELIENQDFRLDEGLPDRYFLVPGFITTRKNPFLILESVRQMNINLKQNYAVVFAGAIDPILERAVSDFDESLVISRSLTDYEIDYLIDHSAATILLYDNVSSSGFALRCLSRFNIVIMPNHRHWRNVAFHHASYLKVSELKVSSLTKLLITLYPFNRILEDNNLDNLLNQDIDVMSILI